MFGQAWVIHIDYYKFKQAGTTNYSIDTRKPTIEAIWKGALRVYLKRNENRHHTLSTAYDEIARGRQLVTITTPAAARREPISIATKKSAFHTSLLPRPIQKMRGENN